MKKKFLLFVIVLGIVVFCTEPVFALNIASCEKSIPGALIDQKIPNIVSTIVTVIKIAVPVLIVIMGMLDLMKGLTAQKEDEIKKGQQLFIKRLISGALVFLVFTIVQFLISFVANDEKEDIFACSNCFINGDCTYKQPSSIKCDASEKWDSKEAKCVSKTSKK